MFTTAIQFDQVEFIYPGQSFPTIYPLQLSIEQGTSFGLFGPNGAGKTTLIHLMTGLLTPSNGKIHILGEHSLSKNAKKKFGFVPQEYSFYPELSPVENLTLFGAWSDLTRAMISTRTKELLNILSLTDVKDKPIYKFSGGMKRRMNLAIGLIANPPIVFLDEPTVGVDVQSRNAIISYLKTLNSNGTTLIYTSHQLLEAEFLCKKIAMIDNGKIIAHDDLSQLLVSHQETGLEGLFLQLNGKDLRDSDV